LIRRGDRDGQRDEKRAAHFWRAVDPYSTTVLFDDTPGDVQPQPHPGEASVVHISGTMETVEHQRLIGSGNTDAVILHTDARFVSQALEAHSHWAVVRAVFERIFDQVGKYLVEARQVDAARYLSHHLAAPTLGEWGLGISRRGPLAAGS